MVKEGFPRGGDLIPAHMLPFKHLKARLGSPCLTAPIIFIDLKKRLPGNDQHLPSRASGADCDERPTILTSFPLVVSLSTDLLMEMDFFSYLFFFPASLSARACQARVARGPH